MHKIPHTEIYNEFQILFVIKSNNFQRKHEFIATPFILQ